MHSRLVVFIVVAITLFGASILIESKVLKESSDIAKDFQKQLKLVNLTKQLDYEIEKHQADMLESVILDTTNIIYKDKNGEIGAILEKLKSLQVSGDAQKYANIISTLEARYKGFKAVEKSLITAIKQKNANRCNIQLKHG
jgi:hypothetical protein